MRLRNISNRRLRIALALESRPSYVIAAEAGLPQQHLSGFVSGRMTPNDDQKRRIAEVLEMSVDDLFES